MAFTGSAALERSQTTVTDPIRVMVVDDSVVVRGLIGRWLDEDPAIAVVASHRNGKLAVDDVTRSNPDVVVLDVEMPEMDGLTALPLLLQKKPNLVVVMASTLTRRNAEVSLKCLSLGAADYIPKPESNSGVTTSADFRNEVIQKIKTLGQRVLLRAGRQMPARAFTASPSTPAPTPAAPARPTAMPTMRGTPAPSLRPWSSLQPKVLLIGSSTGGPQALTRLFAEIGPAIVNVPVLVTQHMPATFTAILAEHITKAAGRRAAEGVNGEPLMPGRIYVAPGGKHMVIGKQGMDTCVLLNDLPPVNFCKPAVDPLFDSAVPIFGASILACVLTGMGHDGAAGSTRIANAGGSVIAQDEESSVVWGMPGAVAQAGAAAEILPLNQIGAKISRILGGRR
ncbi:MAG: chemotaxis response regulator protein-glutamate methylesterase [Siculibacillus sp.]